MASRIILAIQGIPECTIALYNPTTTLEGLCLDLRQALTLATSTNPASSNLPVQYWIDRVYQGSRQGESSSRSSSRSPTKSSRTVQTASKKCYIC